MRPGPLLKGVDNTERDREATARLHEVRADLISMAESLCKLIEAYEGALPAPLRAAARQCRARVNDQYAILGEMLTNARRDAGLE